MTMARIRQDEDHVQIIVDNEVALDLPWNAALDVASAMIYHAKQIEEVVKRAGVVKDQAIIIKAGLPFGLTNNKHLQQEAMSEALYDRDLNRYMGYGIKSKEQVGTPMVINDG